MLLCCTVASVAFSCTDPNAVPGDTAEVRQDTLRLRVPVVIVVEKDLTYDKYTLENEYPYKDTVRYFQWEKIREGLRVVDSIQRRPQTWGILQNRQNANGEGPLTKEWVRNEYKRVSDTHGVERFQSVPLYAPDDLSAPERYGRDGSLVRITRRDSTETVDLDAIHIGGRWATDSKYVRILPDSTAFKHVAFIDVTNQNIAALEKSDDGKWLVRSMNPATTGVHNPPYAHETPTGIFVVQEKKEKMYYLRDGTSDIAGYAPFASRFCNGAYIHGVPTNSRTAPIIEYSYTLGTVPRSHMCVRNASSHAEFIFNWAPLLSSLVIVIE